MQASQYAMQHSDAEKRWSIYSFLTSGGARVTKLAGWMVAAVAATSFLDASPQRNQRSRTVEEPVNWSGAGDPAIRDGKPAILRAQILLDRAHFSPGQIDGRTGKNLDRAVKAFQKARQLQPHGQLDDPTWSALNADTAPVLVPYRVTATDVEGPYTERIPEDMLEKAKLPRLAFTSSLEKLSEMFHVSPQLLKELNPGKSFNAGDELQVPNVWTVPAGRAARIVVTTAGNLSVLDEAGKILAHYPCTSGSHHDPLPLGEWKITLIQENPKFHYNPELFWDADPAHTKAKVAPGPNNPVGTVWIDLTKEHYGIHGTPAPEKIGHAQSHGCIRLTNWDVEELAGLVAKDTPVVCVKE
jgi:lipoprotein-anchoring transpeptidase ErfK/SrfK